MPAITSDQTTAGNQNSSSNSSYDTAYRPLRLRPDDPAFLASTANSIASILISNFLPAVQPPRSENLVVASSDEDFSSFHDVTFDFFDEDDDLFGSPLAFDASDDGLWNGRFVPPPPRPPFFEDEPVLSDGLTTCDLCSWAMPTKSTFIFEGTIEKASELGWPLTLIIVSILSALLGAIIMVTVVRCRRQKSSNNRNETHVQWWSRNKRPSNNNHLRRSNIYTAQPADSIRGLHQPALSASSSLTAMTAMGAAAAAIQASTAAPPAGASQQQQPQYFHQQQQHMQQQFQPHALMSHQQLQLQLQQQHQPQEYEYEYEHEYHQPQELQLQLQQHQTSSSISSSASSPSLTTTTITTMVPLPMQLQQHQHHHHQHQQQQPQPLESSNNIWQNGSTMAVAS